MINQNPVRESSLPVSEQPATENRFRPQPVEDRWRKQFRICLNCGAADMIPAGSCSVCRNCGVSNGCS